MEKNKFRVRDTLENKWVNANILLDHSGLLLWSFGGSHDLVIDLTGIRYVVQFFIGLHDKHGKKIYTGDILTWAHLPDDPPCVVEWIQKEACFACECPANTNYNSWIDSSCEIIGNKYENKDLLV